MSIFHKPFAKSPRNIFSLGVVLVLALWALLPNLAHAAPSYVQGRSAIITSGTTLNLAFNSSNTAGNLIVVYAIWNNTGTATITDTRNTYAAVAPATKFNGNQWSSQVFYAKNVGAGANTVKATFGTSITNFGELYIQEYAGLDKVNPVDVQSAAGGTGSAMNSGSATTTNANDLIFGAGASSSSISAVGSGFTVRSSAQGNRIMDKNVSAVGSYSATATQGGSAWAIHMVAFRAASTAPDTTPPSAPTGLTATPISTSQINLSWTASTDNVGVTGYKVFRDGVQITTTTSTTYQNTGLAAGTTYSYTVSAYDAAGNTSAASAPASATTVAPDITPPTIAITAPADNATVSGTSVAVTADASDAVGVTKVEFYVDDQLKSTDTTAPYSFTFNSTTVGDGLHALGAKAYDAANNVGTAAGISVVVDNAPVPDTTAPSVPAGVTATPNSPTQVTLGWTASTDNVGVTGYRIFRDGAEVATTATTSYQNTGLTAGTTYEYTVTAYDAAANESAQSAVASATTPTPDTTAPSVPANVTATAVSTSQINLSWDASTDNVGVSGYTIFRDGVQITTTTSTTYQNTGLAAGTTYGYTVSAYDAAANNSAQSTAASATTTSAPVGQMPTYQRVLADSGNPAPNDPWMKSAGDLDGDGLPDLMVAGENSSAVWYKAPTWTRYPIATTGVDSQSGSAIGDIDGDGKQDVVIGTRWYKKISTDNTQTWQVNSLPSSSAGTHDIMVSDLNSDGKADLVMRGESASTIFVFLQTTGGGWTTFTISPGLGLNGLDVDDIDGDQRPDIAVGGVWMRNPGGNLATATWPIYIFANGWDPYAAVEIADMDADGNPDIVLSVSEAFGKLSWFKAPADPLTNTAWTEKNIDVNLGEVHGFVVTDVNKDNTLDIIASEYHGLGRQIIYAHKVGQSPEWQQTELGRDSLHNIRGADFNLDGTMDFFGVYAWGSTNPVVAYISAAPDAVAPSVPTGLTATGVSSTQVNLGWTASTDYVGVAGYKIFRGSVQVGTTVGTTFQDSGLTANTSYSYTVSAYDAAGNNSGQSTPATATTNSAPPTSAVPQYVQSAGATDNASVSSISRAFNASNTAGNLIVAAVSWDGASTLTCTDTQGNSYTTVTNQFDSTPGYGQSLAVCYAPNVKAGANTVTATLNGNHSYRRIIVSEYSGVATAGQVHDVTSVNTAAGTTATGAITSNSATTGQNGELIYGVVMDDAATTTITAGAGFTQRNSLNNKDLAIQDMVQASAGPIASTQTFGTAHRYLAHMVTFRPQ